MSSSELRYLIAANELAEQMEIVKQTDVANKLNVSKVSTYNAIERVRSKWKPKNIYRVKAAKIQFTSQL